MFGFENCDGLSKYFTLTQKLMFAQLIEIFYIDAKTYVCS